MFDADKNLPKTDTTVASPTDNGTTNTKSTAEVLKLPFLI